MNGRLVKKVAIVTGSGSGIGKAIALLFAQEGACVVIGNTSKDNGERTVMEIQAAGGKAIFVQCDVSKFKQVENLVDTAVKTYGKLDIMVNNAAIATLNKCAETSLEEWDRGISVNLTGVFYGCKCAITAMLKNGGGSIINVSSIGGLFGDYGQCWYNAAKGGVSNLTRNIAVDYARQGIRCNALNPGLTLTEMTRQGWENDAKLKETIGRIYPFGRPGKPIEVAYCALFLASDEASIVNGVNLSCDGGLAAYSGQPAYGNMEEYLSRKPAEIPPDTF